MSWTPKQKQVIEALYEGAVQFPFQQDLPDGSVEAFVPLSFAGGMHPDAKTRFPVDFVLERVVVDRDGNIREREEATYREVR